MTTLPTYLPGLMRAAVEAGLNTEVEFHRYSFGDAVSLIITWGPGEYTSLGWEKVRGRWVRDQDNVPLADVRARIKREAQR